MIVGSGVSVVIPFQDVPSDLINILFGGIVSGPRMGEIGYRTYWETIGGKSPDEIMIPWDDLSVGVQRAWDAVANAILTASRKVEVESTCECGHLGLFHDMMEFGQGLRCCVDGCTCGSDDHRVATPD